MGSWTISQSWTKSEPHSSETRRRCSPLSEAPKRWSGPTVAWPHCWVNKDSSTRNKLGNCPYNCPPPKTSWKLFIEHRKRHLVEQQQHSHGLKKKEQNAEPNSIMKKHPQTTNPNAWAG